MTLIRRRKWYWMSLAAAAVIAAGWSALPSEGHSQSGPGDREVLLAFGVGGVLTRDGALWQYRLDKQDWVTIDQAFRDQGQETHILPLPVPVREIESMNSFGFIVSRSGDCWLYDLEDDAWKNVGKPSGR